MTETVPPSPRSTLKRAAERGHYDAETIHAIVDASYVCHVAWQSNGNVLCIPTACWRMDDRLYIHGSNGSRMMKRPRAGAPCCVTPDLAGWAGTGQISVFALDELPLGGHSWTV